MRGTEEMRKPSHLTQQKTVSLPTLLECLSSDDRTLKSDTPKSSIPIYAGSYLTVHIGTLKFVTSDVVIVEAELALSGYKSLPPEIQADADGRLYTELEEVFANRPGGWQMISFHNVPRKLGKGPDLQCQIGSYKGD
jgi:hypothetical protein